MTRKLVPILIACLMATVAQAAGIHDITVPADTRGPAITARIWTPCTQRPGEIPVVGPFAIPGVRDCPVTGSNLPLVVISHGLGGSLSIHHDTAEALADNGFAVVALNHPLDSGLDMRRANDIASLAERPADIQRLTDHMLASSPIVARIDRNRIGFFGFSRGGYTGLVLAGAVADIPCRGEQQKSCAKVEAADPRFKAFVIADPLTFFPGKESLANVRAPLLLWGSATGGQGVTPEKVAAVARDLPITPEFRTPPNSAHLSFLMPCPPAIKSLDPEACGDPAGFDRDAFHRQFNARILAFFREKMPG